MNPLGSLNWIDIVALGLSAIGVAIAVVQTYRARKAAEDLEDQRRARNAAIWHNIGLVLNAYETLEDARSFAWNMKDVDRMDALAAKLSSARRCVVDQYLDLLKAAVLDEGEFTEETLSRWIAQGRLENDWRIQQARKFIRHYVASEMPRALSDSQSQTQRATPHGK